MSHPRSAAVSDQGALLQVPLALARLVVQEQLAQQVVTQDSLLVFRQRTVSVSSKELLEIKAGVQFQQCPSRRKKHKD